MQITKTLAILAISFAASANAFADLRPNPAPERSYEETRDTMKLGKYLRCSFSQDFLFQTKEGGSTPDNDQDSKRVIFKDIAPEVSSPIDFATYGLEWENEEFSFYFYMNSQVGEIRIAEKKTGMSAESDLDLSDFSKEEPYVGAVTLKRKEDVLVTDPRNPNRKVPGERFTYLKGSCQFLNNVIP